jgi:hypothetical protein
MMHPTGKSTITRDENDQETDIREHDAPLSARSKRTLCVSRNARERCLSSIVFKVLPVGGAVAGFNFAMTARPPAAQREAYTKAMISADANEKPRERR